MQSQDLRLRDKVIRYIEEKGNVFDRWIGLLKRWPPLAILLLPLTLFFFLFFTAVYIIAWISGGRNTGKRCKTV